MNQARLHQELYRQWIASQSQMLSKTLTELLNELPPQEALAWTIRFQRPRSCVAEEVAAWCFEGETVSWWLGGGVGWLAERVGSAVFLSYPEPLAPDPLAMCGLGLVWAEQVSHGPTWAVSRLGPLLAPAAEHSGLKGEWLARLLASWIETYGPVADRHGLERVVDWARSESHGVPVDESWLWPKWPEEATQYFQQLQAGLVPHERHGQSPHDMRAVLLGLAAMTEEEQFRALALAHKAIQSVSLWSRWNQNGFEEG